MDSGFDFGVIQRSLPYLFKEGMTFTVTLTLLAMTEDDAIYMKFIADVMKPHTTDRLAMNYEMEPGKSVKYS